MSSRDSCRRVLLLPQEQQQVLGWQGHQAALALQEQTDHPPTFLKNAKASALYSC